MDVVSETTLVYLTDGRYFINFMVKRFITILLQEWFMK